MKKETKIIVNLANCTLAEAVTWFDALKSSVAYFRIDWDFLLMSLLTPIIVSSMGEEVQPARESRHFFEMAKGKVFLDVDFYTATQRFTLLLKTIQEWGVKMISVSADSSFKIIWLLSILADKKSPGSN